MTLSDRSMTQTVVQVHSLVQLHLLKLFMPPWS